MPGRAFSATPSHSACTGMPERAFSATSSHSVCAGVPGLSFWERAAVWGSWECGVRVLMLGIVAQHPTHGAEHRFQSKRLSSSRSQRKRRRQQRAPPPRGEGARVGAEGSPRLACALSSSAEAAACNQAALRQRPAASCRRCACRRGRPARWPARRARWPAGAGRRWPTPGW